MKYQFITSMHKPYFDHIGSVMIESWLKNWKNVDCELIIYGEEFSENFNTDKIIWKSWEEFCKVDHDEFSKKIKGPAVRFAKKGFAFLDSMKKTTADKLIWVDADLLFYKEIPLDRFDQLLPEDKLVAFFDQFYSIYPNYTREQYEDKENRTDYGAESGFVILNPKHKNYQKFLTNYEMLYKSELMPKFMNIWYDTEVLVLSTRDFLKDVVDLSTLRTTNKTQTPLNRSWISEYFNHQKAKSKNQYSVQDLRKICGLV
jgi:hypothetical protein